MNISRSQLLGQAVTHVDDFTTLRYFQQRNSTPRLLEVEEHGKTILPTIASALLDVYYALWVDEPTLKEETPYQYWQKLLNSALQSTAYQQMHPQTAGEELFSLIGTIEMGQSVLAMIPEEDRELLQEQAEAQAEADAAQDQIQQANAQTSTAKELLDELQQALSNAQGGANSQEIRAQIQGLLQQSQASEQDARMTLEEAQAKVSDINKKLLEMNNGTPGQKKITQMDRIAQQAIKNAAKEVREVSNLLQSWGIEPGELTREGIPQAFELLNHMRRSEEFQTFKDLIGRMRFIAQEKACIEKKQREGIIVPRIRYGRNIAQADKSELFNLVAHPASRMQMLQRWSRGELLLVKQERKTKQYLGKGPIVICEDGSYSMQGEKKLWSKAICLALAYYARLERRTFVWIHFGAKKSRLIVRVYPDGLVTPQQMVEIAETFLSSGTDFEVPLDKSLEVIERDRLPKADVTLLSDGECAVSASWLEHFLTKKTALQVQVVSVLMDVGETSQATVRQFSDRVETVSRFTAEEAGQKVLRHLT